MHLTQARVVRACTPADDAPWPQTGILQDFQARISSVKFEANLVGILSIPIYYAVVVFLFRGLFLALDRLSEFFEVDLWFLGVMGLWFILPVGVTLSIWLGHTSCRFLLRRWSHCDRDDADHTANGDAARTPHRQI
jgi:hypothetical protein